MNGLQIDITTGDLLVAPSGALIAPADSFIAEFVIRSLRGDIKEHPLLGAEAPLMRAGNLDPFWPGNTKKMLQACRLPVSDISLSDDGLITIS